MGSAPSPVPRFDHEAAADAARALRRLAAGLESDALYRAQLAEAARQGWEGAHRAEFDAESRRHQRTAAELAADLRRVAGQVDTASETARRRAAAAALTAVPAVG